MALLRDRTRKRRMSLFYAFRKSANRESVSVVTIGWFETCGHRLSLTEVNHSARIQSGTTHGESGGLTPIDLRTEYLENPLGVETPRPRLSWRVVTVPGAAEASAKQTAYRLRVATEERVSARGTADLWDSGIVELGETTHIEYGGEILASRMRCVWWVRVRDEAGAWSAWSDAGAWTMGLLHPSDWTGAWIGTGETFSDEQDLRPTDRDEPPDNTMPDPWFRRVFTVETRPRRATAFVASVGYHELFVNGRKVGDAVLAPSVTDNSKRARYVSYEIAELLVPGENVIGLWLGTGWSIFQPFATPDKPRAPIVRARFDLDFDDGSSRTIATDHTWKTHPSPNTLTGIWTFMNFGGEHYDANREVPGWCEPGLNEAAWKPVEVFDPTLAISSDLIEPNRELTALAACEVEETADGEYRVDFGRNFSGWVEIDVRGQPGDRVEFLFSERSDAPATHRLHSAYVIGPSGRGTFKNRFNYCAGRWLTVRGLRARPVEADFRGWLVRNDFSKTASFACSQPLLNQIHDATLWTLENLALGGYIVDCPHRERMGYGGDGHASITTALNHYALGAFCTKWSEDWRDVQGSAPRWGFGIPAGTPGGGGDDDGNLPYTAPTYWGGGGPSWSGFCVHLPWETYRRYGDVRILRENFSTIERWLRFLETKATNDLLQPWGGEWDFLGDWMAPNGTTSENAVTRDTLFFNNGYWIYNLQTAADIARVLGEHDCVARWTKRANDVRAAVHREFYDPVDSSYASGSQASLAMALVADVPPERLRGAVEARLEREIHARGGHIHAGITGGAFLFKALIQQQRDDLVYAMVAKTSYPSWGHMLASGASTFWEGWADTHSRIHSSFLYVGQWFIHSVLGVQPHATEGGFKHFVVRPGVTEQPELTWARGHYESLHGRIEVSWERGDAIFKLSVQVPANTTARVYLPTSEEARVTLAGGLLASAPGVRVIGRDGERLIVEAANGHHVFTVGTALAVLTSRRLSVPAPTR